MCMTQRACCLHYPWTIYIVVWKEGNPRRRNNNAFRMQNQRVFSLKRSCSG